LSKILGCHHGGTDNIRGLASALTAASKNAYIYSNVSCNYLMKILIGSIFLSVIFFSSCKKCKNTKDPSEDTFLSYWYFGAGSYWIYKQDSAEVYDTVTIWSTDINEESNLFKGDDYELNGRYYKTHLLHSNNEFFGSYYGSGQEFRSGGYRINHGDWIMFQNFEVIESGYPKINSNFITFDYPFEVGESIFNSTHVSDLITLNVPAGTFENTAIIKPHVYDYYDGGDTYVTDLYLTPNVGTTKMIMYYKTDTISWSLIEYYSPQYCRKKKK
jgi:hypothetical protein